LSHSPRTLRRLYVGLVAAAAVALAGWQAWAAWRAGRLWDQARASIDEGRWDEAGPLLDRLAWYRPDDPEVIRLRVRAALREGDVETAIRLLARVPDAAPDAAQAHLERARFLMQRFRLREAEADLRHALRLDPALLPARMHLITIYGAERRGKDFDRELWAMLSHGGETIDVLRLLAQSGPAIPKGTITATADEGVILRGCLEADRDDPHVRPALARFLRERGEIDAALALLAPWLRDHPEDLDSSNERLACLIDAGELETARPEFEAPTAAALKSARFQRLRGDWLSLAGRTGEALAAYREATRLAPQDAEILYRLGEALRVAGHVEEADAAFGSLERLNELKALVGTISDARPDPGDLVRAGRLCAELGRAREARAWLKEAIRVDPENAEARRRLAEAGP
jgi:tetratricopeptide (TPR) repeat protein